MAEGRDPGAAKAAREAAAADTRPPAHDINIRDMLGLTAEDIPDIPNMDGEIVRDAYYKRALSELQRNVFAISSANVSVRINSEGIITIEEADEGIRAATEKVLYSLLKQAKEHLLEDAVQLAEAQKEANVDELTGALNRRGLEQYLSREFGKDRREGKKEEAGAGVLFFDIDHFKKINDKHKQAFGDEVIKILVERLQGRARPTDTVARLGGEEIVVWLFDITEEDFRMVARDMHDISKYGGIPAPDGSEVRFTTSVGARFVTQQEMASADDPNVLIAQALNESNLAESRSKEMGRNRVTFFKDMHEGGTETRIMTEEEFAGVYIREKGYEREIAALENELENTADEERQRIRQYYLGLKRDRIEEEVHNEYVLYLMRVQEMHEERIEEITRVTDTLTREDQIAIQIAKLEAAQKSLAEQGAILRDILGKTPIPEPDGEVE